MQVYTKSHSKYTKITQPSLIKDVLTNHTLTELKQKALSSSEGEGEKYIGIEKYIEQEDSSDSVDDQIEDSEDELDYEDYIKYETIFIFQFLLFRLRSIIKNGGKDLQDCVVFNIDGLETYQIITNDFSFSDLQR